MIVTHKINMEVINLRFGNAPSLTVAHTHKLHYNSKIDTAFQKIGIIWYDVRFSVLKYPRIYFKSLAIPRTKNAKTWVAIVVGLSNAATLDTSSPRSTNPISSLLCLSKTKSDWIFISSNDITTYLWTSNSCMVMSFNLVMFSSLKPGFGLK